MLTIAMLVAGALFAVWISIINADLGAELTPYMLFIKIISLFIVGILVNGITQLLARPL
jgi:hypothetical protein